MLAHQGEGVQLISKSLGCEENKVKVARARDVDAIISNQELPETMRRLFPEDKRKVLLVCMVGGTSLAVAKLLAKHGIEAVSLNGGIMGLPKTGARHPSEVIQLASE